MILSRISVSAVVAGVAVMLILMTAGKPAQFVREQNTQMRAALTDLGLAK